ncbi:hypothetical protein BGZ94_006417 [Podila epigama]|nr:hypothetical protein BGZ94_006417 [Podila epigama]
MPCYMVTPTLLIPSDALSPIPVYRLISGWSPMVTQTRPAVTGALLVLAIVLRETDGPSGYASHLSQKVQRLMRDTSSTDSEVAIFGRPLGNVVYMIASQVSTREQLEKVENILLRTLEGSL